MLYITQNCYLLLESLEPYPSPDNGWLFLPVPGVVLRSPALFHDGILHLRRELLQSKVLADALRELLVHLGHATFLQRVRVKAWPTRREGEGREGTGEGGAGSVLRILSLMKQNAPILASYSSASRVCGCVCVLFVFYGTCCAV